MRGRQRRPVRVLVVDDLPVIRDGLRRMLEAEGQVQVVGEMGGSVAELPAIRALRPEVILLGVQLLKKTPVVCRIRAELPKTPIIVLGLFRKQGLAQAMQVGAMGYLQKDANREEMLRAIDQVARGKARLSLPVVPRLITQFASVAQERLGLGLSSSSGRHREIPHSASQRRKVQNPDRNQANFRS